MWGYRFRLVAVPATTTATITIGDEVSGQLETKGAVDAYAFTAEPGQSVLVEHEASDCNATIDISDETGRLVAGSACSDVGPFTLVQGGAYLIHVNRNSADTSGYGFRLRSA